MIRLTGHFFIEASNEYEKPDKILPRQAYADPQGDCGEEREEDAREGLFQPPGDFKRSIYAIIGHYCCQIKEYS